MAILASMWSTDIRARTPQSAIIWSFTQSLANLHSGFSLLLMENCLHFSLSSSLKPQLTHNFSPKPLRFFSNSPRQPFNGSFYHSRRSPIEVMASAGASHCEFSSLNSNSPMQLKSPVGKFLSGVVQNHRQLFDVTVKEELRFLSDDRDAAVARMTLSEGSDEALLHRSAAYFSITLFSNSVIFCFLVEYKNFLPSHSSEKTTYAFHKYFLFFIYQLLKSMNPS